MAEVAGSSIWMVFALDAIATGAGGLLPIVRFREVTVRLTAALAAITFAPPGSRGPSSQRRPERGRANECVAEFNSAPCHASGYAPGVVQSFV